MALDAFLRLTNAADQMVEGESSDVSYAKHIEIFDFNLCSGSDVEVTLGEVGGDFATELAVRAWARTNAARDALQRQAEEKERQKQEKQLADKLQRANASFQSPLQQVTTQVAQETAKKGAKPVSLLGQNSMGFQIRKDVDASSADLFQAYCSTVIHPNPTPKFRKMGHFASAEVTIRRMFEGKARPYLFCSFHDLAIDAYNLSFDSGRGHMVETVTFKFVEYRMKYQAQTGEGKAGKISDISGSVAAKGD